jgi:fungal STAND N-terminal Goodbye domain
MDSEIRNNATFEELWSQAIRRYFASINRSPEDKAALREIHTADDLFAQLEAGHGKFGDWRNKHSKFFSTLSKALRPCLLVAEIADRSIPCPSFAPASTVLGAVFYLVKAAEGVSDAYEWIEELFDRLSGFTQRLEHYVDENMDPHLQQKVVAILACILEILGRSEKVIKDGRFRKYAAVLFLGKDEKVKESLDRLANLVDEEQKLIHAISYATSRRIEGKATKIGLVTERVKEVSEQMDKKLDVMKLSLQGMQDSILFL